MNDFIQLNCSKIIEIITTYDLLKHHKPFNLCRNILKFLIYKYLFTEFT